MAAIFTAAMVLSRLEMEKAASRNKTTGKIYANRPNRPNMTLLTKPPAAPPTPKLLMRSSTETANRISTFTSSRINSFWACFFAAARFDAAVVFFRVFVRPLPDVFDAITFLSLPFTQLRLVYHFSGRM